MMTPSQEERPIVHATVGEGIAVPILMSELRDAVGPGLLDAAVGRIVRNKVSRAYHADAEAEPETEESDRL